MQKPYKIKSKIYSDRRGKIFQNIITKKKIYFPYSITSISKKNVLRGFHFTLGGEYKILTVIKGEILDYCIMIKKNKIKKFKFKIKQGESLFIPKSYAHAYLCCAKENIINYYLSKNYSPKNKKAIYYNDTDFDINWNIKKPILSKADLNAESLKECQKKYF